MSNSIFVVYLDLLFLDEILHTKREMEGRGRCGGVGISH